MVGSRQDPDSSTFEPHIKWCRVVEAQKGDFVSPFGKTKFFQEANVRSFDARPEKARQRPVIDVIYTVKAIGTEKVCKRYRKFATE